MDPSGHYLALMDYTGNLIYFFNGNYQSGSSISNFKIMNNKLFNFYKGGLFFLADSNFNIVDTISAVNGCTNDSHDMQLLSNGNFLILAREKVIMDLSGFNMFTHNQTPGDSAALVTCGVLQEFTPAGQLVWEWKTRDHFAFDDVNEIWLNEPDTFDWTHLNAIQEDADGNILVSSRFFNEIFKVNHSTGEIMWRFGGNHNEFTSINDSIPFKGQHDIRVLPNGNYTLFDNGYFFPKHKAKAEEFILDTINHTATFIRIIYAADSGFSSSRGNAQFLADGKVVIDWGKMSNDNLVFSAVDTDDVEICRFAFSDSLTSYRTYYYSGLPWKINQPEISCFDSLGFILLRAPAGYGNYLWSTGSTSSSIVVQPLDTVWVYVKTGTMGGMLSSLKYIADPTISCENFIPNYNDDIVKIFPNPASENIIISGKVISEIEIENVIGQRIFTESYSDSFLTRQVSIENFSPAIYFVKLTIGENKFVYKIEKL